MESSTQLNETYEIAEDSLRAMDKFHDDLPNSLKFPPHPKPAVPNAERISDDNWKPSFFAGAYVPQTEKDVTEKVEHFNLSFKTENKEDLHEISQNPKWNFNPKPKDEIRVEEIKPDKEWLEFQKRAKLTAKEMPPPPVKPKVLTREEKDLLIIKSTKEKYHLHINNELYPFQLANPLFSKKQ